MQKIIDNKKTIYLVLFAVTLYISLTQQVYAFDFCNTKTFGFLRRIFGYIRIAIPILVIVLGSIDFVKAIISNDEGNMKKAQKDFMTRLLIGVAIFFVPSILDLLLSLLSYGTCNFE